MNSKKDYSDIFDENFEVTYDEETDISSVNTSDFRDEAYEPDSEICDDDSESDYDDSDYDDNDYEDQDYEDGDSDYEDQDYEDQDYDYEDQDYNDSGYERAGSRSRRRRGSGVPLAAPIQKGGRTLSRISGFIIRQLSLILILVISTYVTYTFWRASVPYGDISESIRQRSFSNTLLAYICVMSVFLFFELISFFWSMTKVKVREAGEVWKEDAGRGLTSFILVFAASYLAFLFNRFIPSSPDVLYGIKGALLVYGSMHNTLFGLSAAGVISCLIRRYALG